MERNPESDERDESTLLGDADEVEHPSIEEQLDEKLQQEEAEDGDAGS